MRTLIAVLLAAASAAAQMPEKMTLFQGNTAGYRGYRIPALVMTTKGTLLAFCAARKELGDWADIDIALRRSTDQGKTWEPMRIIADRGTMTVDNPGPNRGSPDRGDPLPLPGKLRAALLHAQRR